MADIVFMGTPEFSVASLKKLVETGHTPIAVATKPDRERGRNRIAVATPVKTAALELGIETIIEPQSVWDPDFAERIRALAPDVIVVVAFPILPPAVYECGRLGAFNLHGSLLPRYRGAAPIHHAIMAGETETGVTTFFLKEKVDTGNIILQRSMPIGREETMGEVMDRMMVLGAEVVVDTVELVLAGAVETSSQDNSLATPAPKILREECRINWNEDRATVHNFIRGLSPFPGAWTRHGDVELKLFRSRIGEAFHGDPRPPAGSVFRSEGGLWIAVRDGLIQVLDIQQEGRRRMSGDEFTRGYRMQNGESVA